MTRLEKIAPQYLILNSILAAVAALVLQLLGSTCWLWLMSYRRNLGDEGIRRQRFELAI